MAKRPTQVEELVAVLMGAVCLPCLYGNESQSLAY